jgi:hypothetical protein
LRLHLKSDQNQAGLRTPLRSTLPLPLLLTASLGGIPILPPSAGAVSLVAGPVQSPPRWRSIDAPNPQDSQSWRALSVEGTAPRTRLIPSEPTAPTAPTAAASVLPADATAVPAESIPTAYRLAPSLGGGVPTGYVGGWGDYYLSASAGTPGKLRAGSIDSSFNLGFSLGDPERTLGLEVNWGIGSFKNFNANGSVGFSAGRLLINRSDLQVAVAGGVMDAYSYGNEPGRPSVNGYGAVTVAFPLRPGNPSFPQRLQFSAGGGGNSFGAIDANFQTTDTGFFVAAGIDVLPNLGVSLGQSSRSTNVNLSWIPLRGLPVFVNLVAADVFDATPFGTVGVLSVGWGDSLRSGFFSE